MSSRNQISLVTFIVIVIAAILSRLIPHPFNFTAIGALALFSGYAVTDKRNAYYLPLTVLLITDLILGFHFSMLPVYGCFIFTVWMGRKISSNVNWLRVISVSLISSVVFYLVTNLPFWYYDIQLYPMTLEGTIQSYQMAIPYFKNQVVGDLVYNAILFGLYISLPVKMKPVKISTKK